MGKVHVMMRKGGNGKTDPLSPRPAEPRPIGRILPTLQDIRDQAPKPGRHLEGVAGAGGDEEHLVSAPAYAEVVVGRGGVEAGVHFERLAEGGEAVSGFVEDGFGVGFVRDSLNVGEGDRFAGGVDSDFDGAALGLAGEAVEVLRHIVDPDGASDELRRACIGEGLEGDLHVEVGDPLLDPWSDGEDDSVVIGEVLVGGGFSDLGFGTGVQGELAEGGPCERGVYPASLGDEQAALSLLHLWALLGFFNGLERDVGVEHRLFRGFDHSAALGSVKQEAAFV